jgi:putative phosphoribosyl transferase
MRFLDRTEAGIHLARALAPHRTPDAVVVAIPRGGVVVGAQVARLLGLPLEVLVACKVPVPDRPELGIGAVAEGGTRHLDVGLAGVLHVSPTALQASVIATEREVARRAEAYRGGRGPPDVRGRVVLLVDDGIARGVTMRAALEAVRNLGAARTVVAAPVASGFAADTLASLADGVVILVRPAVLRAVSEWYEDFQPLRDTDVVAWLHAPRRDAGDSHAAA